jgi:primosomal protein N' (replication factor Y) (superfamily II helicase)
MPRYCEVALPVPLRSTFTYAVPAALDGAPLVGRRVVVPFGRPLNWKQTFPFKETH